MGFFKRLIGQEMSRGKVVNAFQEHGFIHLIDRTDRHPNALKLLPDKGLKTVNEHYDALIFRFKSLKSSDFTPTEITQIVHQNSAQLKADKPKLAERLKNSGFIKTTRDDAKLGLEKLPPALRLKIIKHFLENA